MTAYYIVKVNNFKYISAYTYTYIFIWIGLFNVSDRTSSNGYSAIIQDDSKRWTYFVSLYVLMAPQHTPDSWLRYSKFSASSACWLAWAKLKTVLKSSHVLLWYTWSTGAFAFTLTACLLKSVIPTKNALPRWRFNVETKTKRTLYGSCLLSFN